MEIYRNSNESVTVPIPVVPGATASAIITSPGGTSTEHPNISTDVAVASIPLDIMHVLYDGAIKIQLNVDRPEPGMDFSVTEYVDVVTPLFRSTDLGADYQDTDVVELERLVRHVIEAHTGQHFGKTVEHRAIDFNERVARFNVPLIEFVGVSDRYATHSTTLTPPKIPYELVDNGFGLAIDWDNYHIKTDSLWILNQRRQGCIVFEGVFGYDRVPQDVKEAALLIAGVWGCNQAVWRDRYIRTMRSADWSVTYDEAGFGKTTGSHAADRLLAKYDRKYIPAVI